MRTSVAFAAAALLVILGFVHQRPAYADAKTKKEIQQKVKEAMENYDLLEYEEAKKILTAAIASAKKAKMDTDPVVAQAHLSLGIVYFAGLQDPDNAKTEFVAAAKIDPKIKIDPAYKTADMAKLLDQARSEASSGGGSSGGGDDGGGSADGGGGDDGGSASHKHGGGGDDGGGGGDLNAIDVGSGGGGGDSVDCSSVSGVQHEIVDTGKVDTDLALTANLGADVDASKVAIMYRPQGATDFTEVKMAKKGECTYVGSIPKAAMKGELVHYYIAAFNDKGKVIAGKGSSGSPNIVEIEGGVAGASGGGSTSGDDENPLGEGGGGHKATPSGGEVSGGVTVGPTKPAKVYFTAAFGSGVGFVTGSTEQAGNKVQCCFAPGLVNVTPELGFYIGSTTSVGVAFRLGLPIGANIPNHSTGSPAVLVRMRHWLGKGQKGLQVSGAIGGGVIGDTIKLTMVTPSPQCMGAGACDTDIVAMGPVLVGAGAAYVASVGGPVKLVLDGNAIAGIPAIKKLGSNPGINMNFGVQFDLNLGLMFGF